MDIVFDSIEFGFGNDDPRIVKNFNLTIRQGEFHLLLGPSGCGKTTVLNLLAGFEQASRGHVLVGGQPVREPGRDRIVIFQGDDSLYSWLTGLQNVEFGLRVAGVPPAQRRERAMAYIELVGLAGHENKFPAELSGGMKQRIQIARALVCDSPVLLMDEPFAALDAQTRATLQQELSQVWERTGCTIFFITHDISEAVLLADRLSIMGAAPEAAIRETIQVDLPRPRSPGDAGFAQIYQRVHGILSPDPRPAGPT